MASDCGDLSLIPATAWRGCVKQIGKRLSETQWLIQASACRHSVADTKSLVCARPNGLLLCIFFHFHVYMIENVPFEKGELIIFLNVLNIFRRMAVNHSAVQ